MDKTEIKLDQLTLPEDGQWCVYDDHNRYDIVGKYINEEQGFSELDEGMIQTAFDINFWQPLEIEWEWKDWYERGESLAIVEGTDKYGNTFDGTAVWMNDELISIEEFERVGNSL